MIKNLRVQHHTMPETCPCFGCHTPFKHKANMIVHLKWGHGWSENDAVEAAGGT